MRKPVSALTKPRSKDEKRHRLRIEQDAFNTLWNALAKVEISDREHWMRSLATQLSDRYASAFGGPQSVSLFASLAKQTVCTVPNCREAADAVFGGPAA